MLLFLCSILLLFLISVTIILVGIIGHKLYVRKLAKKYTYQEINERINDVSVVISNTNYKGKMLENLLDHKELWEQVKEYKRTHF